MFDNLKPVASAGLFALVASIAGVSSATAADIYDNYNPRTSSPYDDPRYSDVYKHPVPPQPRYAEPRYAEPRYAEPQYVEPRQHARPSYYDDDRSRVPTNRYGYLEPMNPRYQHRPQPSCVPHGEIRRALINEGWRDFQDLELRGEVARVQARRPNGQLYALKVDRCSGEIVHSQPLHDGRSPYAYRDRYSGNTY